MIIDHQKRWEFLKKKFESDQLSHAYLFSGVRGLGKKDFAKKFAEFVGCKFPDLMLVEPEDGKEISIVKIREIQNFLAYKSYYGNFKIVIIDQVHLMNQEAQSCFLKTLEEPKGRTLLILISSNPDLLLATILSRCQVIKFLGKPLQTQEEFLRENRILQEILKIATAQLSEKFKYAKSIDFEQQKLSEILEVLQKYFRYLLFSKTGLNLPKEQKQFGELPASFKNYPISKIKKSINLIEYINQQISFTNVNSKLALEYLLMEI